MGLTLRCKLIKSVWDAGLQGHINTIMAWDGMQMLCPSHFFEKEPRVASHIEETLAILSRAVSELKDEGVVRAWVHLKEDSEWRELILEGGDSDEIIGGCGR